MFAALLTITLMAGLSGSLPVFGQSRRQPPTQSGGTQKKNKRPDPNKKDGDEELPPDLIGKPQDAETIKVSTQLVNVDAVVYHKKSGKIITGLKQANFAIFEDGVKQEITNFSTPEAPITVALVLEYSKLGEALGRTNVYEDGREEVLRPAALFLSRFVRPPDDYVSVIAYDMRPTPLTDFTNDPTRINQVINLLLRNHPAFRETNLFDALKFTLIGGRGDAVVLDNSKESTAEYAGMASVQGRRKAILLVASGLDTFSKINYGQARKIAQNAGVPIYIKILLWEVPVASPCYRRRTRSRPLPTRRAAHFIQSPSRASCRARSKASMRS
ncbi:MAG: VWA domain-containing protein [Acidobacteria bacterium]|nr:VWA domain-containing protein [Acidobacteriota bacterium]